MTKDTRRRRLWLLKLCFWMIGDAIEDGVRARARGFIETMLEEELSEALSRRARPAQAR